MRKSLSLFLIILLLRCASEEVVRPKTEDVKNYYCIFNQLDGECVNDSDDSFFCSQGTCSSGDCKTGIGSITYPMGSLLKGTFKNGKLNGAGMYSGCGENFEGTFKDNLKVNGLWTIKTNANEESALDQYYEGQFQNEMINGKGIYYSVEDSTKIYEGIWNEGYVKNGSFTVYSGFTKNFPISEKGIILKSSYKSFKKVVYINDRDKEEIDQEEKYRKQEAIQQEKELKERKKQEAYEKKYQADRSKAKKSCENTGSRYSPECVEYIRIYGRD